MDLIKKNWQYIALIVFGIVIYFMFMLNQNLRDDNKRFQDNIAQILLERDSKVLEVTKKEFKEYYAKNDSLLKGLMDSVKLNYRHIERTINHKYESSFDTTITLIKEDAAAGNHDLTPRKFRLKKDCVELIATIDWANNIATVDTDIKYNATTVYYWKRKHQIWFIKFGRKQYYAVTKNNCTRESKVIDITFKK